MSIVQHWQTQKDALRAVLSDHMSAADTVRHVRHTLLQVEQNALAEMDDDLLRQQASVLMGSLKGSVALLEAHGTAQIWIAQKSKNTKKQAPSFWHYTAAALALLAIWCVLNGEWIALILSCAGFGLGFYALIQDRKNASALLPRDQVQASVTVDIDQLFTVLDSQIHAMDRYLGDFGYLNDQARGGADNADAITLSRAADLMEALYDCDEAERASAENAARRLLEKLGLQALDYCEKHSKLFNALPSKSVTRTLSPAIVSVKEQQLLRRGTAAVRIDAA
jgi:hypothetical protein